MGALGVGGRHLQIQSQESILLLTGPQTHLTLTEAESTLFQETGRNPRDGVLEPTALLVLLEVGEGF